MDWILIATWASKMTVLISFLKAAFGLGLVIFVHELGHFLVAKACGVKCEKFYVGFDVPMSIGPFRLPSALFRRKWGETEYGIGIIPLGGYVKMLGQDDNPANAAKEAERIKVIKEEAQHTPPSEFDPRSYPAKSVPQRMAIISAGVIMNLIFAVIFAAVAYKSGVEYTPCAISRTVPGSPAWQAGMQPGDKILKLGVDQPASEELSFTRDLVYAVSKTLGSQPLELLVRHRDGRESNVTLQPVEMSDSLGTRPKIGASPPWDETLLLFEDASSAAKLAGLKSNDRVIAASWDDQQRKLTSPYEFAELLARYPEVTFRLTVERPRKREKESADNGADSTNKNKMERLEIELPPQPIQDLGLIMTWGEVVSTRKGSPADTAGFVRGDRILTVDGEQLEDPLQLDDFLRARIGKSVPVLVTRTDPSGKEIEQELTVVPAMAQQVGMTSTGYPTSAETIGLAFHVTDTVASILPDSPAERSGIQVGDEIRGVRFRPDDTAKFTEADIEELGLDDVPLSDKEHDWPYLFELFQSIPEGLEVELQVERDADLKSFQMPLTTREHAFNPQRGIYFTTQSAERKVSSWSAAWSLGISETRYGVEQVFFILRNIGSLFKNLGGPIMIASVGTQEASQGISRLLLFLSLLSANLAVLNMLPIPVLDGGHMMFLLYEGIVGKPVNERITIGLTMIGLFFILGLMVFVFSMDIYRLFTW